MRIDPRFARLLTAEQLDVFRSSPDSGFGLWANGAIAATNDAWDRFAHDNDGGDVVDAWPLGRSVWDAVPTVLVGFYRAAFESVVARGVPWHHDFHCSSPGRFRLMRMLALPVGRAGLLVMNSARVERNHEAVAEDGAAYRDAHGLVHQCAHCRRVRRGAADRWDFVPALVAHPDPRTSHALCPTCLAHHYPT